MSVTRFGFSQRHDIAFITDEFKFYFFSLRFAQHIYYISYVHLDKIREILAKFEISAKTEIIFQDTIDHKCPLYLYFMILHPCVKFNLDTVPLSRMMTAIYKKHTTYSKRLAQKKTYINVKNVNMFLARAWGFIVEDDICPWMSKQIDGQLKLCSADEAKHQIRARMCIYYMFIRKQNENIKSKRNQRKLSEKVS